MSRQRRAHVKSREGCAQCKERHVKCNEVHPQCWNCKRHGLPCSFSAPTLTATPLNQGSLADLELLHYWHHHNHQARAAGRPGQDAVGLGFSHHYLLNSILALAALQLFDEDRSQTRWYARAVAHRQAAITRANPHLRRLEESQHAALLNFFLYTSLYTIAEPLLRPAGSTDDELGLDPLKELLQAIRLGRCSTVLVRQHLSSAIGSDPLLVAKYRPRRLEVVRGLEDRFPQLAQLRDYIERQCAEPERTVCLDAANSLFVGISRLTDDPDNPPQIQAIWDWASNVDEAFLQMCFAQSTAALVVFAHFAVLMSLGSGGWYIQGWPAVLLRQIRYLLEGLEDAIQWPSDVIFGNAPVVPLAV